LEIGTAISTQKIKIFTEALDFFDRAKVGAQVLSAHLLDRLF
jgi:hypothetical protein